MKENQASILEMADGAILERADVEMAKILENIYDPNTKAESKRSLTITVDFVPDSERQTISVKVVAKSKLESTKPIATALYVKDKDKAVEMVPQLGGQMNVFGEEQKHPKVVRLPAKQAVNE